MFLPLETFRTIVASTPLIAIDLIVRNLQGQILLGKRLNRPAQGSWFVPGGRVLKNETLDDAFERLTHSELGRSYERSQASFLGIYEHFYEDSVFGQAVADPSSHYVVLAYQLFVPVGDILELPAQQHAEYRWDSILELNACSDTHENTRAYLLSLI
ncbi:GDP-mannose mannosyl hydrolase [Pseudomonas sp. H9]|uniref:GDP-mannose mannosyl hydrolase n=1 Tax=Pseudomonas sp. H9 TaxID=483968 RepID=UPI001058390E|nr:GDP-mannose mannosyl hydrolase [Pseudomonas sp. H9]TDF81202.1 GDP-mannose mannosyl hydrolase [Pseudomonas sp. H9]